MLTGLFDLLPFTLRGLALGLAIAAPVGPIGVLCIRRTLAEGRLTGFVTGLGAATADAFYGGVAAFGVSAIPLLLSGARPWIHLLGAVFIAWLAVVPCWRSLLGPPSPPPPPAGRASNGAAWLAAAVRLAHYARPDADQSDDDPCFRRRFRWGRAGELGRASRHRQRNGGWCLSWFRALVAHPELRRQPRAFPADR